MASLGSTLGVTSGAIFFQFWKILYFDKVLFVYVFVGGARPWDLKDFELQKEKQTKMC